jgi:hypothetical protein
MQTTLRDEAYLAGSLGVSAKPVHLRDGAYLAGSRARSTKCARRFEITRR